ncbi:MAG: hypothetical protein WC180_05655 [Candidatus Paceibacterota bacterium]
MKDKIDNKQILSPQERKANEISKELNRKLSPKEFCEICVMQNCNPLEIPSCILLREAREKNIVEDKSEKIKKAALPPIAA